MLFLKRKRNPVTVIERKLNTGTDCKMSMTGIINFSACLFFAASEPKIKVNIRDKNRAINKRIVVLSAYAGRKEGFR